MALPPADHRSLAATAAERIRAAIDSGDLQPGDRLVERRLAEELGISQIPIREALAQLAEEGTITRTPRRGARVAELSARDLEEIASLRTALEELAVERVMERRGAAVAGELEEIVAAMVAAAEGEDAERFLELDREFHEHLWESADHTLLNEVAGGVRLRANRFRRGATMALSRETLLALAEEHGRIAASLEGDDVAAARAEMRGHIERAHGRIADNLAEGAHAGEGA